MIHTTLASKWKTLSIIQGLDESSLGYRVNFWETLH